MAGGARSLRVTVVAARSRPLAVALAAPLPVAPCSRSRSRPCRRAGGGVALGRHSSATAALALGSAWRGRRRRSPLALRGVAGGGRSVHSTAVAVAWCPLAVALAAPPLPAALRSRSRSSLAQSCRRAGGGVTLDRRSSATAALALGSARRGRRGARSLRVTVVAVASCPLAVALAALPLPATPRSRSRSSPAWPCCHAGGGVALGRRSSAAAALALGSARCGRRRRSPLALRGVASGARSVRITVVTVARCSLCHAITTKPPPEPRDYSAERNSFRRDEHKAPSSKTAKSRGGGDFPREKCFFAMFLYGDGEKGRALGRLTFRTAVRRARQTTGIHHSGTNTKSREGTRSRKEVGKQNGF